MNNYHLVYNSDIVIRNFTYKTHKLKSVYEDNEDWKGDGDIEASPRGAMCVSYRIWMRNPANRAVIAFECHDSFIAFDAFGRLMDLVRAEADGVRPWRVFAMVELSKGNGVLYEISFLVIGDEYRFQSARLVKLRELTGIVGNEQFPNGKSKP